MHSTSIDGVPIVTALQIFTFLGGLGVFLYGIRTMSYELKKAAGVRFKIIIEKLTKNVWLGVIVGAIFTGLIQSSGATTFIAIGLANAGVMTLKQSAGIIMGANIGTTVTAQIIRLGDIQSGAWYLLMLKPDVLAPLLFIIGFTMVFAFRNRKINLMGKSLIGLGLLFFSMNMMGRSVSGLHNIAEIQYIFKQLENPIQGLLAGTSVTAVIHSSAAAIGVLQAISGTGLISFSAAVPIIIGFNIGTCVTAIIASVGMEKTARKVALINLYFNLMGAAVVMPAIYLVNRLFGVPFWYSAVDCGGIADFHTAYNIACVLIILPVVSLLVKLADMSVR